MRYWRKSKHTGSLNSRSFPVTAASPLYAARGASYQEFQWGDAQTSHEKMRFGQHRKSAIFRADTLPMASVNDQLGMSPFGLHHTAGNIWQWCRDWYDQAFYQLAEARQPNPVNQNPTKVRSERGGSWIGPAELCRSSYRRGRPLTTRGLLKTYVRILTNTTKIGAFFSSNATRFHPLIKQKKPDGMCRRAQRKIPAITYSRA